jgi:hypothetical protein
MPRQDEIDVFVKEVFKAIDSKSTDAWESFFGRWFVCRFKNLNDEMGMKLEVRENGSVTVYANSGQQCRAADQSAKNYPEASLSDIIAGSHGGDEDAMEAAIRKAVDDGIARMRPPK